MIKLEVVFGLLICVLWLIVKEMCVVLEEEVCKKVEVEVVVVVVIENLVLVEDYVEGVVGVEVVLIV